MEVHHHSHTHKKKWTHYFWEFLMLFLAVFCGFLAEYQLEHTIENQRERKYILSFIEDLKADTVSINQNVISKIENRQDHDSLIWHTKANLDRFLIYRNRGREFEEKLFSFSDYDLLQDLLNHQQKGSE